jgi:hypothetical protein
MNVETRTSGPAIAYPAIYPKRHAYYRVDLGLDAIGFGLAPDDNVTSYRELFPNNTAGGTGSVPYMFTLYSQGGVWVALVGSLLVGVLWRIASLRTVERRNVTVLTSWAGALVIAFGVFIAGDSVRNSILASYGILVPGVIVAALAGLRRILVTSRR